MVWKPFVIHDVVNHEKYFDKDGVLVFAMYKAPKILFMYPSTGRASMIVESPSGKRKIWVTMSVEELKILKRDIEHFFEVRERILTRWAAEGLDEMFSRIEERDGRER